jgi:phosphate transport system protein
MRRDAPQHSSREFEAELRELRAHLLAMGARCERSVQLAFEGFLQGACGVVQEVSRLDVQIDRDELEIHALILRILALRQPVADDLRFLATALRLVTDLERIGDEAVNIAERAMARPGELVVTGELRLMAAVALEMLHSAMEAFVQGDDDLAAKVLQRDDEVDQRCAVVIDTMTAWISENASEVPCGLHAIRVAKYLERIADHATNIAEEDIFMIRGDDVRHGRWQAAE